MKKAITTIVAIAALTTTVAGCAGGAGGGGLGSNSITNTEYQQVHTGQPSAFVRGLLGKPESIDNSEIAGLGKSSVWIYSGPNDTSVMITLGQAGMLHPHGPLVVDSKSIG
jgi:hypothetical protein